MKPATAKAFGHLAVYSWLLAAAWVPPSNAAGAVRVSVDLPLPPKINTVAVRTILVARFISSENPALDPGREFVRYVRRELAKSGRFKVLDVEPPNLPEQPPEELIRNATFWKHIAEEYGADLVVSGRILFGSTDRSGFVQQDSISPVTGQKVRETVFAEREEFSLEANVWFFKGANGALVYDDTFRDAQIFDGKSSDPVQIFFNLTDRVSPDLWSVLNPGRRKEPRYIFEE